MMTREEDCLSVLVLVSREEEAQSLVHWAGLFARARICGVVVLDTLDQEQTDAIERSVRRAEGHFPALPKGDDEEFGTPEFTVVRLDQRDTVDAVLAQIKEQGASLLIVGRRSAEEEDAADLRLAQRLLEEVTCPVLLLRPVGDQGERAERILVLADRGPHAPVALELGAELAAASGGRLTAVLVETDLGEDAEALGKRRLERRIARLPAKRRELVDGRVVLAGTLLEGLSEASPSHDLVLFGTESPSFIRRVLTRALPIRSFRGPEGTSVAVVRRAIPLRARLEHAVLDAVTSTVPQLNRKDRVALVDRLRVGSRWSFDFILLTCLSTLIAALGLIAGNLAVVIGAMLVAPLMTPLLGAGLALVHGNLVFLRRTLATVSSGFFLALGIGCLVGLLAGPEMTPEMQSRGSPGVIDLAVAFASGMAAAYAIGRPDLSAALPGVAIAAALVPPIATTGLALAIGGYWVAAGAALLFFTNLVAIVLGSALSLFAVGVRSVHLHRRQTQWTRRVIIALFLLAAVAVVPLCFQLARLAEPG